MSDQTQTFTFLLDDLQKGGALPPSLSEAQPGSNTVLNDIQRSGKIVVMSPQGHKLFDVGIEVLKDYTAADKEALLDKIAPKDSAMREGIEKYFHQGGFRSVGKSAVEYFDPLNVIYNGVPESEVFTFKLQKDGSILFEESYQIKSLVIPTDETSQEHSASGKVTCQSILSIGEEGTFQQTAGEIALTSSSPKLTEQFQKMEKRVHEVTAQNNAPVTQKPTAVPPKFASGPVIRSASKLTLPKSSSSPVILPTPKPAVLARKADESVAVVKFSHLLENPNFYKKENTQAYNAMHATLSKTFSQENLEFLELHNRFKIAYKKWTEDPTDLNKKAVDALVKELDETFLVAATAEVVSLVINTKSLNIEAKDLTNLKEAVSSNKLEEIAKQLNSAEKTIIGLIETNLLSQKVEDYLPQKQIASRKESVNLNSKDQLKQSTPAERSPGFLSKVISFFKTKPAAAPQTAPIPPQKAQRKDTNADITTASAIELTTPAPVTKKSQNTNARQQTNSKVVQILGPEVVAASKPPTSSQMKKLNKLLGAEVKPRVSIEEEKKDIASESVQSRNVLFSGGPANLPEQTPLDTKTDPAKPEASEPTPTTKSSQGPAGPGRRSI